MRGHHLGVLSLVLALPGAALALAPAGGVQPAGQTYLKLWDRVLIGSRAYTTAGDAVDLGARYQDHALRLYLEHGLTERITAIVDATPLGIASFGDETTAYAGLVAIGLRLGLAEGPLPLALEVRYGYAPPLGDAPVAAGEVAGQAYRYQPALERHVGAAELQLGWRLDWFWTRASAGTTFVAGADLDPFFEAALRAGFVSAVGIAGDVGIVLHAPFRDPEVIDVTGVGDTRFVGLVAGVSYALTDHVALRVDLGLTPYGESSAASPSLGVGVELRR